MDKRFNILGRNPCRTKLHADLCGCQILRLHTFQCFHVHGIIIGIKFCCLSRNIKFFSHVARKIFICRQILSCADTVPIVRIQEHNAFQITVKFFFALARQLRHIFHIHHCLLSERKCKCFACRIHMVDHDLRLDGTLREHIRFGFQFLVFIKDFKGAKQEIGIVIAERKRVPSAVKKSVLLGKGIVKTVQLLLQSMNSIIAIARKLCVNECSHRISNGDHTLDAVRTHSRCFNGTHNAVVAVIDFAVYKSIRIVLYARICGNGIVLFFCQFIAFHVLNLCMNLGYRIFQSIVKVHTVFCAARRFFSERARAHDHITKYHVGMIDKILIHGNADLVCGKVNPISFTFDHTISLLQKDNIRYYARTCVILKGIIWQTDRTDKIGTLREIFSDGGTCLIECTTACDERHDTAGTNLIQCFCKEKVMDQEVVLIVLPIHDLELTERHVADCHVEKAIRKLCFLISVYSNALFLIKLTCDSARNAVKLYTVDLGLIHRFWQKTDEVTDTARRFKDIPTLESHISECIIHGFDDNGRRIESRQGGFSCRFIFFGCK